MSVQRETFDSPYQEYADRVGQPFELVGEVDPSEPGHEHDPEEVGVLYRIRFEDGTEIDAWPEEVFRGVSSGWRGA